ncbi:hypothetical protein V6N11_016063 [Hibiscus sabdariffa]|uniref:Uncharacterized protein n=1 Tax=Hibiscus sabdariffa TaxID=183260 RepID=A0ABR2TUG4_9ROSI
MALVNEDAQKQGMYRNKEREQRSSRVSELIIKTINSHSVDDCCDISKDPPYELYLSSFNPIPTDTSNFQLMAPNYGKKCNYGKAKAIMDEDMGDQISDSFQKISVSIGKKRKGCFADMGVVQRASVSSCFSNVFVIKLTVSRALRRDEWKRFTKLNGAAVPVCGTVLLVCWWSSSCILVVPIQNKKQRSTVREKIDAA